MQTDKHPSSLEEGEYTFALNSNIESHNGNTVNLQNEPSNIYCSYLSEGFVVVGYKKDLLSNRTYFFSTNPSTGTSEIGYIEDIHNLTVINDTELQCNCDYKVILDEPLENQEPEIACSYTVIMNDACNKCLNFSVFHPMRGIVIKDGKLGKRMYFTDNYNPPRYLDLDKLSNYLTYSDAVCDEAAVSNCDEDELCDGCLDCDQCPNCEKLKVFRNFNNPCLVIDSLINGGNLKMGSYQFAVAYSDAEGNELSEYYSITNPIRIFNDTDNILNQTELNKETNYGIKLDIEHLDTQYSYYKIVVIQNTSLQGDYTYYVDNVYPISTNEIIYTTEKDKERITLTQILAVKTKWDKVGGMESSNGSLFQYDLEAKPDVNLQPAVILMSPFLRWFTGVADENLYKDGSLDAQYSAYLRNENYPFSIKFFTEDGYITSPFILTHRPPTNGDNGSIDELAVVVERDIDGNVIGDNQDIISILRNSGECEGVREKYWQFYNSAAVLPNDDCVSLIETEDVSEISSEITCSVETPLTSTCKVTITLTGVEVLGEANIKIQNVDYLAEFDTDLTTTAAKFVTDWAADILLDTGAVVTSSLNVITITDLCSSFPADGENPITITTAVVDLSGVVSDVIEIATGGTLTFEKPDDYGSFTNFLNDNKGEFGVGGDYEDVFLEDLFDETNYSGVTCDINAVVTDNCTVGSLVSDDLYVDNIVGELETTNYVAVGDMIPSTPVSSCNAYYIAPSTGLREFSTDLAVISEIGASTYKRNTPVNNTCLNAVVVGTTVGVGYHLEYEADTSEIGNLATDINTGVYPPLSPDTDKYYLPKLHKKAIWFRADFNGEDSLILEIPAQSTCDIAADNLPSSKHLRISFFDKPCPTTGDSSVEWDYIDLDNGLIIQIDRVNYSSDDVYIALDSPIKVPAATLALTTDPYFVKGYILPPCGCTTVITRPLEYLNTTVSWTDLDLFKELTYNQVCTYSLPKVDPCGVVPYIKGTFGYWESLRTYPDNKEMFDVSGFKIESNVLTKWGYDIGSKENVDFIDIFTDGGTVDGEGNYVLNTDPGVTKLYCQPIRHYKMPNNDIAPFMYNESAVDFTKALIFPLGVSLDNRIINSFLDVAVTNNLITQKFRDSITGYEILRGDRSISKSIISKGLIYDAYRYEDENNEQIYYANYPYNSLGADKLHTKLINSILIDHPHSSDSNNRFMFHGAETHFMNPHPAIPTEIEFEGYQYGKSRGSFQEVLDHPKYVILGRDAYRLANTLAGAEAALETAVVIGESYIEWAKEQRVGTGGANPTGWGILTAYSFFMAILGGAEAVGRYARLRYQWLQTFKNNGKEKNFAAQYSSYGWYNSLKWDGQAQGNLLRGLASSKYLKGGGRYSVTESGVQSATKINNEDRESSLYLSFGNGNKNALTGVYDYADNLSYASNYKRNDNYDLAISNSSRRIAGESTYDLNKEFDSNIGSPYISIKNYNPTQYGDIHNIKWINTGYCGRLSENNTCDMIFGGDIRISRMSLKRKMPMFLVNAMGQANFTPFAYSLYNNVANTNYFIDFDIELSNSFITSVQFPNVGSQGHYDTRDTTDPQEFYLGGRNSEPYKFYLFYYGIPQFLVESDINLNYRYGRREPHEWFYPNGGATDYKWWTQEKNVSIKKDNEYNYNYDYSRNLAYEKRQLLPAQYNKYEWDKRAVLPNGVIASQPYSSEFDRNDPWLNYKPFDVFEFPVKSGKLISLKDIESNQILARFENQSMIMNSVDTLRERLNADNIQLGVGVFGQRPIEYNKTDLGFAGTQHREVVSNQFGHFWTDAKRGQIIRVDPSGKGQSDIAGYRSDGTPSGLRNWFRENLPFKILKGGISGLTDLDVDNSYNNLGICMAWDNRFNRLFITKKDYIVKDAYKGEIRFSKVMSKRTITLGGASGSGNIIVNGVSYLATFATDLSTTEQNWVTANAAAILADCKATVTYEGGYIVIQASPTSMPTITYTQIATLTATISDLEEVESNKGHFYTTVNGVETEIYTSNTTYFEDCSFTVAYNPLLQGWISFYSFKPSYYIPYQHYFQTGYNTNTDTTLWSHLLTNRSYTVFNQTKYNWEIEVPRKEKYSNSVLNSIEYWLDSRVYLNEFDYSERRDFGFDEAVVYNNSNNSGLLKLVNSQINNRKQATEYPKFFTGYKEILQTESNKKFTFNHFFNQVRKDYNNINIWSHDNNGLKSSINDKAMNYLPYKYDRIRGDWFLTKFISNRDSRVHQIFKFGFMKGNDTNG